MLILHPCINISQLSLGLRLCLVYIVPLLPVKHKFNNSLFYIVLWYCSGLFLKSFLTCTLLLLIFSTSENILSSGDSPLKCWSPPCVLRKNLTICSFQQKSHIVTQFFPSITVTWDKSTCVPQLKNERFDGRAAWVENQNYLIDTTLLFGFVFQLDYFSIQVNEYDVLRVFYDITPKMFILVIMIERRKCKSMYNSIFWMPIQF